MSSQSIALASLLLVIASAWTGYSSPYYPSSQSYSPYVSNRFTGVGYGTRESLYKSGRDIKSVSGGFGSYYGEDYGYTGPSAVYERGYGNSGTSGQTRSAEGYNTDTGTLGNDRVWGN